MKTKLHKLAAILFLFITFYSTAQDIEGSWNGVLKIQGQELPIVFNISINDDILNTTMDSPSQGAVGITTDSTSFVDNILMVSIAKFGISYAGSYDGTSINGTFTQNGKPIPLDLIRGEYKIEPKEYLKKVKCPVLALNGEKDFQVLAEVNLEGIKNALGISNNTDFTTEELKDLNHLFQTSVTGSFNEYASNEESFSPIALEIISKWINERFANKK